MTALAHQHDTTEAAIVSRLIHQTNSKMPVAVAKYMLTIGFDDVDQERMLELAERNQLGQLSSDEHAELMNFVRAGHLLSALQSKARKELKKNSTSNK